jgi:ribonuclease HII
MCWAIGRAEVEEIDDINILQASLLSMSRAVDALTVEPGHVLVDGNKLPKLKQSAEAIVKGDLTVAEISAASIIAKVARDKEMKDAGTLWPEYGFEKHMGYPTAKHLEALKVHGICPIHRKSYAPVQRQMSLWDEVDGT